MKFNTFAFVLFFIFIQSCGSTEQETETDIWTKITTTFEGNLTKEFLKPKLENAMQMYGKIEPNDENLEKCASALISLRKASTKGITEMDIITHMINYGDYGKGVSFADQAGKSAAILELK